MTINQSIFLANAVSLLKLIKPRMGICIALLFRADFCNWQRHSTFLLASLLAIFANELLLYLLHLIHDKI